MNDLESHSRSLELPLFDTSYQLLLVVCSIPVSILHRFRDITTCTVYVTARDLEKSISLLVTTYKDIKGDAKCRK